MSGGGGSTNTVQSTTPWAGEQPALSALYSGILQSSQNGGLYPNLNTGQTAALTSAQRQALDTMASGGSTVTNQAMGLTQQLALGQFSNSPGAQGLYNIMNGTGAATSLADIAKGNFANSQGLQSLQNFANGSMLNSANSAAQQLYQSESQPILNQLNNSTLPQLQSQFSAAGRTGSGANALQLNQALQGATTSLGNLSQNTIGANYEQQMQNMLNASNQLGQIQTTASQGLGSLAGSAANNLANLQGSAITNLNSMGWNQLQQMLSAGNQYQTQAQNTLNSNIAQSNYNASSNLGTLQAMASLLSGLGNYSTTSTNGSTSNNANIMSSLLGAGMLGSSLYGSLGAGAAAGTAIGAGTFALPAAALAGSTAAAGGTSALMGLGAMGMLAL